jgi:hypothetical protein
MSPVNKKTVDELRKLYKSNAAARSLLDYFAARERNARRSPVERLCAVTGISRADVIDLFRKLEEMSLGRFLVGRRGQPSRFEWDFAMISVGQAATGETANIEQDEIEDVTEEAIAGSDGIKHHFRLRPDFPVELELPANLTSAEANRLADFIKTLPFNPGS